MAKRLNPLELVGGHKCKDKTGIQAMLEEGLRNRAQPQGRQDGRLRRAIWPSMNMRFIRAAPRSKGASASNYLTSVESMCKTLDIKLTEIPDWNCCGASDRLRRGSGEVPRHVMNARNFALSEKHLPGQEMVATCAACWLGARETRERQLARGPCPDARHARAALKEAGLDDTRPRRA